MVLATSVAAKNVTVDQTQVVDPQVAAEELAPLLNMDVRTVQQKLTGTKRFNYVALQVTPAVWAQVAALKIPGILSEDTTRRIYPAGGLASNVVGFVGRDGTGLGGLELADQQLLAGVPGSSTFEGVRGTQIPTTVSQQTAAVPGSTVRLTIDRDIQFEAQQAIAAQVKAAGADSGTVVVMDVKTGAIYALATAPGFDPSDPGATPVEDRGNRALSDIYEPGSTSKVMTAAAVLQEGTMTPNTVINIPNTLQRAGKTFHDSENHPDEHLTLTGVLAKSSNIGAIQASETDRQEHAVLVPEEVRHRRPDRLGLPRREPRRADRLRARGPAPRQPRSPSARACR